MAAWKRRSEAKDDNDASRKPSTLFWREDSGNKPRIETIRKKNPSGMFSVNHTFEYSLEDNDFQ